MDKETFDRYLEERYEDQIKWYDKRAGEYQKKYRRLQWLVIVLASLTPVLIELSLNTGQAFLLGRLATLTSLVVAILTAALKTFKYQENWINYRTTCETLRKERHYYDAGIGEYSATGDKEALFVDRVESLISRENTMWVSTHKKQSDNVGSGTGGGCGRTTNTESGLVEETEKGAHLF